MSCHYRKTIKHGNCSRAILKFIYSTGRWICLQSLSNKKPVYNSLENIRYGKQDSFSVIECDHINTITEILMTCQTHES